MRASRSWSLATAALLIAMRPLLAASPLELELGTTPITYEFSKPGLAEEALNLTSPKLAEPRKAGLDSLLERVASARGRLSNLADRVLTPPAPRPSTSKVPPRNLVLEVTDSLGLSVTQEQVPAAGMLSDRAPRLPDGKLLARIGGVPPGAKPSTGDEQPFKLTTKLDPLARTYGEFSSRNWSALSQFSGLGPSSATARKGLDATRPTPTGSPQGAPGGQAGPAVPDPARPGGPGLAAAPTPGQPPQASASADPPANETQARESRPDRSSPRRRGEGGMLILPDFDVSGFQIGTTFSLTGRNPGRLGFSDSGPTLDAALMQPRFGLESTYRTPEGLRLNATYERELSQDSQRVKPENRLWTGVVFNF